MTNINTFQGDVFIHEYIKHTGDDNSLFGFSGGDTFKIATGGTDRLTVKADGTVGIGTNAPISVFHTFGGELWDGSDHASKVCATLAVARGGGAGGAASTLDAGTGAILKLTHDGTGYRHATMESVSEAPYSGQVGIRFKTLETGNTTAPLERMRITGSGKVGIGTDAPESLLHLSASTASADITDPIKIKIHNRRGAGDWSITQPWGLLEFDTDDTGTAGSGPVAGIGCRFEQAGGGDASICFYTDNVVNDDNVLGAANERMCINSDGKVGVGTASPLADLDVNGNIKSRGNLYLAPATIESDTKVGTSDAFLLMHHSTYHGSLGPNYPRPECGTIMTNRSGGGTFPWLMYTGLVKDVAASTPVTSLRMDWGQGSSTGSATDLEDATLNPLMTLRFSGQLGLGTTAPATKLHLEHSGSAIGDFEGIRIANHATNLHSTSRPAYEFVVSDIDAGTGIGANKFAIGYRGTTSASRTNRIVIDSNGRVGIGTNTPADELHVQGDIRVNAGKFVNPNQGGISTSGYNEITNSKMIWDTGSRVRMFTDGDAKVIFSSSGGNGTLEATSALSINGAGSVGVRKTNSYVRLHVYYNYQYAGAAICSEGAGHHNTNAQQTLNGLANSSIIMPLPLTNTDDIVIAFKNSNGSRYKATIDGANFFTGQHAGVPINYDLKSNVSNYAGLIVCPTDTGYKSYNHSTALAHVGQKAIEINESLPYIKLSETAYDKSVFGVLSNAPNNSPCDESGVLDVDDDPNALYTNTLRDRVRINSLGEGAIWVTDLNGHLENGDYITSSNISGYGMKQDSEFLANYTVAKITMSCDFNPKTIPVKQHKKITKTNTYWVKRSEFNEVEKWEYDGTAEALRKIQDFVKNYINTEDQESTITIHDYELLDSNEQSNYTPQYETLYMTQPIDRRPYEDPPPESIRDEFIVESVEEVVDDVDANGISILEDVPSGETELEYKIKHIDSAGVITDEAGASCKAAFVGCTYHCG